MYQKSMAEQPSPMPELAHRLQPANTDVEHNNFTIDLLEKETFFHHIIKNFTYYTMYCLREYILRWVLVT